MIDSQAGVRSWIQPIHAVLLVSMLYELVIRLQRRHLPARHSVYMTATLLVMISMLRTVSPHRAPADAGVLDKERSRKRLKILEPLFQIIIINEEGFLYSNSRFEKEQ